MTPRRKTKRRRMDRSRNVETAIERQLQQALAVIRAGLGNHQPTFHQAIARLRQEVIARGGDGVLRDCQCFLCQDGRSAMLYADWGGDQTIYATFALPTPVTESAFDARHYIEQAEG